MGIIEKAEEFAKKEYQKNDPININLTLKNEGRGPVYVNKRFHINSPQSPKPEREVYLLVTSPKGENLACKIDHDTGYPKSDYFVLLQPGEKVSIKRQRNIKYYYDFSSPGTYTISAVYQNAYGKEIGLDVFSEKISSKPVKIKISE